MSLIKLFLSGLLIAGGLILGAFTLHGYFDPQWAQKQMQAAGPREVKPAVQSINSVQTRNRFVSSRSEQTSPGDRHPATAPATANPMPGSTVKTTDSKLVAKPPQKKKVAEKPKPAPPQQASVWPWNLFNN